MFSWMAHLLAPPVFNRDDDKNRQAHLLSMVSKLVLVLGMGLFLIGWGVWKTHENRGQLTGSFDVYGWFMFASAIVVLVAVVQSVAHAGRVRFASIVLTVTIGVLFVLGHWLTGVGIRSPLFMGYILVAFIAGLLLGRRWTVIMSGLSLLMGGFLVLAERGGIWVVRDVNELPWLVAGGSLTLYGLAVALFYIALRNFDRSLARAREINQELDIFRTSLEARVEVRTRDLSRRARYLEATAEVARYVTSELAMAELLTRIVMLISEEFGFYHAGIFLLDPTGAWAELQAASSPGGQAMLARGHRLAVGQQGMVGYVTAHGESRMASDVGVDAVFFDNPDLPETRSAVVLPLHVRGRIIGALDVQSRESAAFSQEDVAVLQILADQVAVAISNARLFERLQESIAAERRAYGELSYQAWGELFKGQGELGYIDSTAGTYAVSGAPMPEDMQIAGKEGTIVQEEELVSIPVTVHEGQSVLGVVRLRKPDGAGGWTPEQVSLMQDITEQLGVALERARLYQDSQRMATRERLVSEATGRMRQTLDVEAVLKMAADEIYQALQLDEIVVRLATKHDE
ncbi:MAG: GAF domain-containing protein [Anaerolineae bacterium]|nr:GAF domain-containing protein [Anaerolineae bacterium]